MNYYTSDPHFGHEKIIQLCNRPFSDIETMNKQLVENYNNRCSKDDTLFILGDVSRYGYNCVPYLKEIKAKKVLVIGNHDEGLLKFKSFRSCFDEMKHILLVNDGEYKLNLSHYPMAEWDGYYKGRILFYGHVHNSPKGGLKLMEYLPNAVHVGVDVNDFLPKTAKQFVIERQKAFHIPAQSGEALYRSLQI